MLRTLLTTLCLVLTTGATAADLQIIAGGGMTGPLKELAPKFEAASGHKLIIRFAATPELIKMATSSEPLDAAVVPGEVFMDGPAKARFILSTVSNVARVGFGVAVAVGAPKPDISTPEAFKQTLLKAKSVATLPASAAGAQVLKTFETLGIADAMKAKTIAQPTPGDIPRAVAKGEAELAIFLINVIAAPGVEVVGPFPDALQQELVFRAALATDTQNAIAAKAFIDFLKSPVAVGVIKAQGLSPG